MVAIYYDNKAQNIAHVVDTIESACAWIKCSPQALYKSLHLNGVMKAKGFIVERVNI